MNDSASDYEPRASKGKAGLPTLAWLALALVLGIVLTVAAQNFMSRSDSSFEEQSRLLANKSNGANSEANVPKDQAPNSGKALTESKEPIPESAGLSDWPTILKPEGMDAKPDMVPGKLPFGPIPGGPVAPITPVVLTDSMSGAEREARKETRYVEISIRVPQVDLGSARARVASIAKSAGGSSKPIFEARTIRASEREGLLLSAPASKLDEVVSKFMGIEIASLRDEWKGPFSERQIRIERNVRDALSALELEERQALERYLDDAPPVVDVRERIEKMRRELASLPRVPSGMAAVRVYLGHRV